MELPATVLIHNQLLGLKGGRGTLLRIASDGYYELNLAFGQQWHRVLLPIKDTVIIHQEPETVIDTELTIEVER